MQRSTDFINIVLLRRNGTCCRNIGVTPILVKAEYIGILTSSLILKGVSKLATQLNSRMNEAGEVVGGRGD